MDIMQMAAAVSLSDLHNDISGVQGPFYSNRSDWDQMAFIWLKNGYGVKISKDSRVGKGRPNCAASDTAELKVVRKAGDPVGAVPDYSTPVTSNVLGSVTVEEVVEALRKLLPLTNDPDDLRVWGS